MYENLEGFTYRPIVWSEFKRMPWEEQNDYIGFLRNEFGATCTAISSMFGVACPTLSQYCKEQNYDYKFNRVVPMTKEEEIRFAEFCRPIREITYDRVKSVRHSEDWDAFRSSSVDEQVDYLTEMITRHHCTIVGISMLNGKGRSTLGNYVKKKGYRERIPRSLENKGFDVQSSDAPTFLEWRKMREDRKESDDTQRQMTLLPPAQDSKSNVIPMRGKVEWVDASTNPPEVSGRYYAVFIMGYKGSLVKGQEMIEYDDGWKVNDNRIITHWLSVPEIPELKVV